MFFYYRYKVSILSGLLNLEALLVLQLSLIGMIDILIIVDEHS